MGNVSRSRVCTLCPPGEPACSASFQKKKIKNRCMGRRKHLTRYFKLGVTQGQPASEKGHHAFQCFWGSGSRTAAHCPPKGRWCLTPSYLELGGQQGLQAQPGVGGRHLSPCMNVFKDGPPGGPHQTGWAPCCPLALASTPGLHSDWGQPWAAEFPRALRAETSSGPPSPGLGPVTQPWAPGGSRQRALADSSHPGKSGLQHIRARRRRGDPIRRPGSGYFDRPARRDFQVSAGAETP